MTFHRQIQSLDHSVSDHSIRVAVSHGARVLVRLAERSGTRDRCGDWKLQQQSCQVRVLLNDGKWV